METDMKITEERLPSGMWRWQMLNEDGYVYHEAVGASRFGTLDALCMDVESDLDAMRSAYVLVRSTFNQLMAEAADGVEGTKVFTASGHSDDKTGGN